jgi:mannosyltransferase
VSADWKREVRGLSQRAFASPLPLIVAGLTVLGAALRLHRLDTGLWFDEIVTLIAYVRPSLTEIVTQFPGNNNHPLYSVFAHVSVALLGEDPWTVRLPSALFGVAAIPALYLVGTTVTSRLESLLAASILTVSYHHIWFSQNARGYTLLLLCVLLATYFLLRWLAGGGTANLAAYAVVAALGAYTHLTMVFVSVTHAAVCAFDLYRRRASPTARADWRPLAAAFIGAGVLTVLFYAPMLTDVQAFFTNERGSGTEVATPIWALLEAIQGLKLGFGTAWAVGVGALVFGTGMWSYLRLNTTALLLFLLPVPVTFGLAVAMGRPIFPRFALFAMGFVLLVTVRGASVLGRWSAAPFAGAATARRAGAAAAAAMTFALVALSLRSLPYGYRYPKQDFAGAVAFVEQNREAADLVAVIGVTGAVPVRDYLQRSWPRVDRGSELQKLRLNGRQVWVLFTFPTYIETGQPDLWTMLHEECVEVAEFDGTVAGGSITVSRCAPAGL